MSEQWYYAKHGQQLGPVSMDELTQLASSGQLQLGDLVWKEGMANWAPARTVAGLFASAPRVAFAPPRTGEAYGLAAEPEPAPAPSNYPEHYDRPDDDYPRRRPRRGANGVLIGVGVAVAVVLVIGIIVVIAIVAQSGNPRSFSIRRGTKVTYNIEFKGGQKAQIWVTSDHDSDVDLFVYDSNNRLVKRDEGDSKDCYVEWMPPNTQTYRVEVVNRVRLEPFLQFRNRDNHCTLRYSPP